MDDPANWLVLTLVGGVLFFFVYVVIKGRQGEQTDKKEDQPRK